MRLVSILSTILTFSGVLLLLLALFMGVAALQSLSERLQYGRGPLFADVELFAIMGLVCAVTGAGALWFAKRLSKRAGEKSSKNPDEL